MKRIALREENSCSPAQEYQKYFCAFLPQFLNQALLEDIGYLTCNFGCRLSDLENPQHYVAIASGRLKAVSRTEMKTQCCFVCDISTFFDIVGARISPQDAFFDLRVDIEGDIELGLKLSAVLEIFFSRYPYPS